METTYIIISENTGRMIECHDEISRKHCEHIVKVHNEIYPADQWEIKIEKSL